MVLSSRDCYGKISESSSNGCSKVVQSESATFACLTHVGVAVRTILETAGVSPDPPTDFVAFVDRPATHLDAQAIETSVRLDAPATCGSHGDLIAPPQPGSMTGTDRRGIPSGG